MLQAIGNNLLKAVPDSTEKNMVQDALRSFSIGYKAVEKTGEILQNSGQTPGHSENIYNTYQQNMSGSNQQTNQINDKILLR